ncbi:GDP-perosamine synthase [Orchesella cincta]|uniref:GDP-perosamine synthase n=1 Tax=Orchesella cincta TaxID=48709 RepID=A0A1D2N935_ORCCI|nr:GDP-perosamine synthase [Orchesella cincta]
MPRIQLLSNPRSGSCYLQELLNCHPEIEIAEELLNDEFGILENPFQSIEKTLAALPNTFVGFKVFPEQVYAHNLHFGELLQATGTTHVIVLWREGILEALVSRRIAETTGQWYSTSKNGPTRQITIDPEDLESYIEQMNSEWEKIGTQWPVGVRPVFLKFEDLLAQPVEEVKRILSEISCASDHVIFTSPSERQNPAKIQQKVINFHELPMEHRNAKLDVEKILRNKINNSLQISPELMIFAPDREPVMPALGWRYRVADPYLPPVAKQYAMDAIQSGSISSAGFWPRELAKRLRALFQCPVAQPCSNGFTALLLAMQASNLGKGDQVITPTLTMIAVPNSIEFVGATPVFADNAKDDYNPHWEDYLKVATENTKAIVVTHTYGVPVPDIEEIARQCKARGWILIEDISECVGVTCTTSDGKDVLLGTFGDYAIASLYANKIIHGGDGGFVIAKEAQIGKRLASIVNHGFTPSYHFVHFEISTNSKINGIGAAIASGCLDEIETIMKHRAQLSQWYRAKLEGLPVKLMPICGPNDTPWVFGIQCSSKTERTKLRAFMAKHRIETRDYFFNNHLQPAYQRESMPPSLPNAEILGSTGFYLPTHTNLNEVDVDYICNTLKSYFSENQCSLQSLMPTRRRLKSAIQIQPDGFAIEVRKYRESGELLGITNRGHIYIEAVQLGWEAEQNLMHEQFDRVELTTKGMKQCLAEAENEEDPLADSMRTYFSSFINYYESQLPIEKSRRAWLSVNLNDTLFNYSKTIPTTTDPETLQILVWLLQKFKPSTIWEIGSWMGHATALMSSVCNALGHRYRIFACDAYRWQTWMVNYLANFDINQDGKSFLNVFKENIKPYAENVEAVIWPYDISKLPQTLENQKPQFVFLDITQEADDLEQIWSFIKPNLIPNETIILFNGLLHSSIPFFTKHSNELIAIAKPHTIAKVFRYVSSERRSESPVMETYEDVEDFMRKTIPIKRNLRFHTSPGWDHHHRNLFCKSIDLLKESLHSDDAEVVFIPAIEETMCDEPEIFYENQWIGIIHSVADHPELFYTPDLKRLCTRPRYLSALKNCRGLFTLTSYQAEYLKTNLPKDFTFPIQRLLYPTEIFQNFGSSLVPSLISEGQSIELLHIGSFARDFNFFFTVKVPSNFTKVLVAGDSESTEIAKTTPQSISVTGRLSAEEYEKKLHESVIFLTLKYEGAANTLILECISRNVPILAPAISSCTEYLGQDYPLLYNPATPELDQLLTLEKIQESIAYLQKMDKSKFNKSKFLQDVEKGAVMLSIPPCTIVAEKESQAKTIISDLRQFPKYDVTICICSYKRTHHLPKLLESLWENQDFKGTYQIIIWNNNDCRNCIVRDCTKKYIESSSIKRSLELISSSENYYCSIRFAMPALMKSDCLLICDDDILPGRNFISFFHSAHSKHPKDVLCVRGHVFSPHELQVHDPTNVWMDYDNLRFHDDDQPEQFLHFVHADACLIPKQALQEVSSVTMPDQSFTLVDDYWMSYILNDKFGRKLRKLSVNGLPTNPIVRTDDSDKPGLALHTRPEVQDARIRLYVHHMLQGWPKWSSTMDQNLCKSPEEMEVVKQKKQDFWNVPPQIGFNISSTIDKTGIEELVKVGTKCVRIGAVGVGESTIFELSGFLTEPETQLEGLSRTVEELGKIGINVVITLERRLVSPEIWKLIAKKFATYDNVMGYDLINEPFTEHEQDLHWVEVATDVGDDGLSKVVQTYLEIISSIREVDALTCIILEPTFWGRLDGLFKFPVERIIQIDSNIVFSFHFYEPMMLTSRCRNKGRYTFPCSVPWYENVEFSEETYWNEDAILTKMQKAKSWADTKGVRIFLGEFGISRDIGGAADYLRAVMKACKTIGLTGMVYSFRDVEWEAMNYEFGPTFENCVKNIPINSNPLMRAITEGIADMP